MRAEAIARALGGRRVGIMWMVRCPAHDDHTPSLSVREAADGKVLVRCHAGCEQRDVIDALRSRGLWNVPNANGAGDTKQASRPFPATDREMWRSETARRLWRACIPAAGSIAETYLEARGVSASIPPSLRFHPNLKHPSGERWPAMVALVTGGVDGAFRAVHRTFLAHDGSGKAPIEPQRMMLGPCRGGAVRLAPVAHRIMVGEGIETCLAAMQATGEPAWAALSAAGLRALDLPSDVRQVTILADGDDPGEAAAQEAARRWMDQGRRVRIARPGKGLDFNDLLLGRPPRDEEYAA